MLRIGLIGAGSIYKNRYLPNLKKFNGLAIQAICNRSRESSERTARQFHIPDIEDDWLALVKRPDLDAIFIGTWPYRHCEMSIAVLENGKHCFCQARMAMNYSEAKRMAECAEKHPNLVSMVCPAPYSLPEDHQIREILASGWLGVLTGINLFSCNGGNLASEELHWRENILFSGRQILSVGIFAEVLNRWFGEYKEIYAQFNRLIKEKKIDRKVVEVQIPQIVAIQGVLETGTNITEWHSGVAAGCAADRISIQGSKGSLTYDFQNFGLKLMKPGEPVRELKLEYQTDKVWNVEEEFIHAVRSAKAGLPWKVFPNFQDGLKYMKKMEAIHQSAREQRLVQIKDIE